jgi:hypothetical protein
VVFDHAKSATAPFYCIFAVFNILIVWIFEKIGVFGANLTVHPNIFKRAKRVSWVCVKNHGMSRQWSVAYLNNAAGCFADLSYEFHKATSKNSKCRHSRAGGNPDQMRSI